MSMDIYISVVDAIRCGEFHPQGCDGAGSLSYKFNLLIPLSKYTEGRRDGKSRDGRTELSSLYPGRRYDES